MGVGWNENVSCEFLRGTGLEDSRLAIPVSSQWQPSILQTSQTYKDVYPSIRTQHFFLENYWVWLGLLVCRDLEKQPWEFVEGSAVGPELPAGRNPRGWVFLPGATPFLFSVLGYLSLPLPAGSSQGFFASLC